MNTTKIFVYGFPELVEPTTIGNMLLADAIHDQTNWDINYDEIYYISGCVWDHQNKQFQPGRSAYIYVPYVVTAADILIINAAEVQSSDMFPLTYELAHSIDDNTFSNGKDSQNEYYNYGHQNRKMSLSERATYTSKTYVIPQHRQNCIAPQSKSHTPIDDTPHITILQTSNTIQPTRAPSIPTSSNVNGSYQALSPRTPIAHGQRRHDRYGDNIILPKLSVGHIPQNRNHKLKKHKNIGKKSSNRKAPETYGILNHAVTPNKSPPNTNPVSHTIFDTLGAEILDEDENIESIIINENNLSQNISLLITPTPNHISSTPILPSKDLTGTPNNEITDAPESQTPLTEAIDGKMVHTVPTKHGENIEIKFGDNISIHINEPKEGAIFQLNNHATVGKLSTAHTKHAIGITNAAKPQKLSTGATEYHLISVNNMFLLLNVLQLVLISIVLSIPSIKPSLTPNGYILNDKNSNPRTLLNAIITSNDNIDENS